MNIKFADHITVTDPSINLENIKDFVAFFGQILLEHLDELYIYRIRQNNQNNWIYGELHQLQYYDHLAN